MTTDDLINRVILWGKDRHIDNPLMQMVKVQEETGEVAHELARGHWNSDELKDALGDSFVTLIILADILGFDLRDCLDYAYSEIKGRKGTTVLGGFVKEDDKIE